MTMGEKIRGLRRDRQWTLKELAEKSGVSASYISALEKGQRPTPSFECVERLSLAFCVPLDYFSSLSRRGTASDGFPTLDHPVTLPSWPNEIQSLYDDEMQAFIAAESSRPYVAFARQLATEHSAADPAHILQLVAQFLREQRQRYDDGNALAE